MYFKVMNLRDQDFALRYPLIIISFYKELV